MQKYILLVGYLLIVIAAFSRLLPHPLGFTAIGALGLFSGAYINKRWAWAVPLLALLIGDLVIGFYNVLIMLSVYIGFAVSALVGRLLLNAKRSLVRMGAAIFIAELIFFLVSNTASWWVFYPHSMSGLLVCYINGLPYFGRAILANALYCSILFGAYALFQRWSLRDQQMPAVEV